jgi:hypothetical protein
MGMEDFIDALHRSLMIVLIAERIRRSGKMEGQEEDQMPDFRLLGPVIPLSRKPGTRELLSAHPDMTASLFIEETLSLFRGEFMDGHDFFRRSLRRVAHRVLLLKKNSPPSIVNV